MASGRQIPHPGDPGTSCGRRFGRASYRSPHPLLRGRWLVRHKKIPPLGSAPREGPVGVHRDMARGVNKSPCFQRIDTVRTKTLWTFNPTQSYPPKKSRFPGRMDPSPSVTQGTPIPSCRAHGVPPSWCFIGFVLVGFHGFPGVSQRFLGNFGATTMVGSTMAAGSSVPRHLCTRGEPFRQRQATLLPTRDAAQ